MWTLEAYVHWILLEHICPWEWTMYTSTVPVILFINEIMEPHLILITSITPLTHPWLPSLVWTSQWRFMVSFLALCTGTTQPMPSMWHQHTHTHSHRHDPNTRPTHTYTPHSSMWLLPLFINSMSVIDHYSIQYGRCHLQPVTYFMICMQVGCVWMYSIQ